MRDLVIAKLTEAIKQSDGYGIQRWFDCEDDEMITDANELNHMDDEQLLEVFELAVGFQG